MKAIQTTYNEIEFRSRLEARWAIFFDEIGVAHTYEPHDIGKGYVPDFFLHDIFFPSQHSLAIAEIKPLPPNEQYLNFLKSVRRPGESDFFVFVGNPSFVQPDGFHLFGSDGTYIQKGFVFDVCRVCGYYYVYESWHNGYCGCHYCPPSPNWERAAEKANNFRFDLEQ